MYKLSIVSKDKIIRIFVIAGALIMFACTSNEEVTIENEVKSKATVENSIIMSRWGCPDGFVGVWSIETDFAAFQKFDKLDCKRGLGFCFKASIKFVFDCVRAPELTRASFIPATGIARVNGIVNDNNTISFYFHKDIANGGGYGENYYSEIDVSRDFYLDASTKLIEGIYQRVLIGDYYVYTVPFIII